MRLTALQLPARFDAFDEQLRAAELLLEGGPRTDVVLLSEAILTGYVSPRGDFSLTRFAEPLRGAAFAGFAQLAQRFDALVVGPVIERDGDACFNALLGVTPDGAIALHYRKRHPWFPETWATAGATSGASVSWRGRTLVPAICFDVHFLSDDHGPALDAADVLLFSSAWVDDEGDSLPGHLTTLAARHHVSVLCANWGPGTPAVPGQGGSMFVGADGVLVTRLATATGRVDVTLP